MRRLLLAPLSAFALLLAGGCATLLVHAPTLTFGFDYDDYHFVRPYAPAELLAAFHGPWDPAGIEVPFYRPLTIAFHALRFELFGLNAEAYHALSLLLFAFAAAMAGWLVLRLAGRWMAGIAAVILFVTHPAMPYSLVAWVTNQMHLIETLVVLGALIWWDAVRRRGVVWWLPLLLFGAAAFLIKEDGVMLLPVIVVLHAIRRRLCEPDLPRVPRIFIALAAVLMGSLLAIRAEGLSGLGGYSRPNLEAAWDNYSRGLTRVFRLVPADRKWQPFASWFATLVPIVALVCWRRASPGARATIASGAAVALLFNMPFVFVSKNEQMHLVAAGAVLVLAGSVLALVDAVSGRALRIALAAAACGGIAAMTAVSRDIARDFEPYGPMVLAHDEIVRGWGAVPYELRDYLASKREPGAAARVSSNPVDAIARVAFGVHGPERSPDGMAYEWMAGPRTEIHVTPRALNVTIPIRHAIEAFREPARVDVRANRRAIDAIVLDTSQWRTSRTALRPADVSALRRMHRIVLTIDHAWRPSEVIPGSTDTRVLGLQIGELR